MMFLSLSRNLLFLNCLPLKIWNKNAQFRREKSDGSRNYNALTCCALGVSWIKEGVTICICSVLFMNNPRIQMCKLTLVFTLERYIISSKNVQSRTREEFHRFAFQLSCGVFCLITACVDWILINTKKNPRKKTTGR